MILLGEKRWPWHRILADRKENRCPQSFFNLPKLSGVNVMRLLLLSVVAMGGLAMNPSQGHSQLIRFHRQNDPSDMSIVRVHGLQERENDGRRPVLASPDRMHSVRSSNRRGPASGSTSTARFASPVRIVDHRTGLQPVQPALPIHTSPIVPEQTLPGVTSVSGSPAPHAHQIIDSPFRGTDRHGKVITHDHHHPPVLKHHFTRPQRAAIPEASREPVWKTPYSYGYFGARGLKHWHRHVGYRDRSIEWQYR